MSCGYSTAAAVLEPHSQPTIEYVGGWRVWLARVDSWIDCGRQRQALAELDDRLLRDIGRTRAQAAGEAAKAFWRT